MLGASFLLGGLKHHIQEYNRAAARLQAGLLFLATVALLLPSAVSQADSTGGTAFSQTLSVGLAVLLIMAYGLGMLFSLKTHRAQFASAAVGEAGEAPWPLRLALATLAGVTVMVALVSEVFVESVQRAAEAFGMTPTFVGFIVVALVGAAAEMATAFGAAQEPLGPERGHRIGQRLANRALCCPRARAGEPFHRADTHGHDVLAWRGSDDSHCHRHGVIRYEQWAIGVVRRSVGADGLSGFRHDAVPVAAPDAVKGQAHHAQCARC